MNSKFNVGDTVRITNMRELRHDKDIGVVIKIHEMCSVVSDELTYYYNVSILIRDDPCRTYGPTEYRYWRAEEFLEMVKMKKEAVVFN